MWDFVFKIQAYVYKYSDIQFVKGSILNFKDLYYLSIKNYCLKIYLLVCVNSPLNLKA